MLDQNGVPRISNFAIGFVAAVLLAVVFDPQGRADASVNLHRWTFRYVFTVVLELSWLASLCILLCAKRIDNILVVL